MIRCSWIIDRISRTHLRNISKSWCCRINICNSVDKIQICPVICHCQFIINWNIIIWIGTSSCINLRFTSRKVKIRSDSWTTAYGRITIKTCICNLGHQSLNGITKTFTLFCISSICCWCRNQSCWLSYFFLNCCDSCLDFRFSSCVCQFCLVIFSNINEQFCFWNVLIQDRFFIFLSRCFWCSRYHRIFWFWMWSRTTCAFSMWLTSRGWLLFAKWYRFRDSLWQFCWYRLWQWYWGICACLSINWRACRLLACWWCYWSFWCWSCTQDNRLRIGCYIMITSQLTL